jgi:hypothetical protein
MTLEAIRSPYLVPYHAQIASPELAQSLFSGELDPLHDPRWAASGASSPEEYAYWTQRACGPACVQMCVEAFGGPRRRLLEIVRAGLAIQGYLFAPAQPGHPGERGWRHQALADLIRAEGFHAQPQPASLLHIRDLLRCGGLAIASVSYELGSTRAVTHAGGHLVVVTGMDCLDGSPSHVILHNPSGRTPELQANARIPAGRFSSAFSERIIAVEK